jgi:hypothetical protein
MNGIHIRHYWREFDPQNHPKDTGFHAAPHTPPYGMGTIVGK